MTESVKAIVSAAVILVVEVAGICGVTLDTDLVTQVVSAIAIVAVTAYGIWKNHNFTSAAVEAQTVLYALKNGVDMDAGCDERRDEEDEQVD